YERYADTTKIEINDNGTVTWPGNIDMPTLEIPLYKVTVGDQEQQRYAFHMVKSEQEKQTAIAELQKNFPGVPLCKDEYQYEVNCIEVRKGHGIPSRGNHHRPDFTRYEMNPEVVDSMVKAANLGANIDRLFSHELYYRSKGEIGERLSQAELTSTYDNLSVWLWNDEQYEYKQDVQDELGFKRAVEILNCYTNNTHQGGSACGQETQEQLAKWSMITESGELNPSYPLNWMEKPLTRMMLGRSYWDLDISVDTTGYPGRPLQSGSSASVDIHTNNKTVIGTAGSMQSTGLWAPQLENVTISGGVKASINVALVDDLTGRANHELSLKRPPRVQKTFQYDGAQLTFKVPYGGLIYIQPLETTQGDVVTFNFNGVLQASWWKDGKWVNNINADVPLAEIDSGHFIYTTPVNNVLETDVPKFADELNAFANHASDFYGRDQVTEDGKHRRFTYDALLANRHRFVNDVQISIGAAHSGYPVQSNSYWPTWTVVPTNPTNDWLLWHEVGHNLASAPFMVAGSTEVTNNILALYMQEQRKAKPYMDRIASDLSKSPLWLDRFEGHAWSEADVGMRLAMFGQLKLWAEDHFNIDTWYSNQASKPSIF
ncbi:SslE/AcfD family lipoprotein zinc metalloprotease, partial [Vibrio harveyi]|uniref:SslE/AcfD family lipoprotein zinc metalloprotease n=1 Tax=Vibrio harveyi TaxID=669 RepID=UPI000A4FAF67